MTEFKDITEVAIAGNWVLPAGWSVRARTEHDDSVTDPRHEGDVYNTDVEEADYNHPTKAFCKHCGLWIQHLTGQPLADAVAGRPESEELLPDLDGGLWRHPANGSFVCLGAGPGGHEPDDPLIVRWWRQDKWEFVGVLVDVVDLIGQVWGRASLWGVEQGTYPTVIDPETGEVTSSELDPLTDRPDLLAELVGEALAEARAALPVQGGRIVQRTHVVTIQPATQPDLSRPKPYHIIADGISNGEVLRQEFWRGRPQRLLGFQRRFEVQEIDLLCEQWLAGDIQAAVGMYPVFWCTHDAEGRQLPDGATIMVDEVPIGQVLSSDVEIAPAPRSATPGT